MWLSLLTLFLPLVPNILWGSSEVTKQVCLSFTIALQCVELLYRLIRGEKIILFHNRKIVFYFLLLAVSFVISTLLSQSIYKSFFGSYERMQGLATHLLYFIWGIFALLSLRNEKIRTAALTTTFAVGFFSSIMAIDQYISAATNVSSEILTFGIRSFAFMGNPTELGQFLIFPFFAGVFLFINQHKKRTKIFALIGVTTILIGLITTANRASLLGLAVGIGILLITKISNRKIKILSVIILGFSLVAGVAFMGFNSRSLKSRLLLWPQAISIIRDAPFFGSGPDTYKELAIPSIQKELYQYEKLREIPDRPHNSALEAGAHRGVFGILLYVIPILFLIRIFIQKKSPPLNAAILASCLLSYFVSVQFGFSLSVHVIFQILFWALLLFELPNELDKSLQLKPKFAILPIVAIFVLCALYGVSIINSAQIYEEAIYSFNESSSPIYFANVLTASPRYSEMYEVFFELYATRAHEDKNLIPFLEEVEKNYERTFHNELQTLIFKGSLAAAKNDSSDTRLFFENAVKIAPNWPSLNLFKAKAFRLLGDAAAEKNALKEYIELAPPLWHYPVSYGLTPNNETEAERIFRISNQDFYQALERYSAI